LLEEVCIEPFISFMCSSPYESLDSSSSKAELLDKSKWLKKN